MKTITLSFDDLDRYHLLIPMIKKGNQKVIFSDSTSFHLQEVSPYCIDMTLEEKTELWKEILNPDTTLVQIITLDDTFVAGAITVTHSPKCNMLKRDMTNAVLWDIRVHPDYQNKGLASELLNASIAFAKKQKCNRLLIETQDNNPKAISFYVKHGASLLETNPDAYPQELNETQYILQIKF